MSSFKNDKTIRLFIEEAQDIVQGSEELFLKLEGGEYDSEDINEIGRKMHTLKGSAALIGFNQMSHIAHVVEDIFEKVKTGTHLNEEEFAFIFAGLDKVKRLVDSVLETGSEVDSPPDLPPIPGKAPPKPPPPPPPPVAETATPVQSTAQSPVAVAKREVSGFSRVPFGTPLFKIFFEEFFEEAESQLVQIEQVFMMFEIQVDSTRLVGETQKSLNQVRQYAVMLGQSEVAEVCVELSNMLGKIESGKVKLSEELVDSMFPLVSGIRLMLDSMDRQEPHGQDLPTLLKNLERFYPELDRRERTENAQTAAVIFEQFGLNFPGAPFLSPFEKRRAVDEKINGHELVEAFLDFGQDCIRRGFHPKEFAMNLEENGGLVLACVPLVKEGETDRERFWMLVSARNEPVRMVEQFQFIADLGKVETNLLAISNQRTADQYEEHRKKVASVPLQPSSHAEKPSAPEAAAAPEAPAAPTPAPVASKPAAAPPAAPKPGSARKTATTIRVETKRLDDVMNLVGELVIGRIRLEKAVRELDMNGQDQAKALKDMEKLSRDFDELMAEDLETSALLRHQRLKDALRSIQDQVFDGKQLQPEDLSRFTEHLGRLKDEMDMLVEKKRGLQEVLVQLTKSVLDSHGHYNKLTNYLDALKETNAQLSRYSGDLQDQVMKVRMLPIKQVFDKFPRSVRDLSQKLGKEVEWTPHGEDTELDKTLVEKIEDPLMHLVRNAIDHGLETIEERKEAGKNPRGILRVSASQEGNNIVIKVEDDGRGIHPRKILDKAIEKKLVDANEAEKLSRKDIYNLLFAPGFSTAAAVTEISGRGVGMDVVKDSILQLKGIIDVQSEVGKGTSFIMKLPLTLAIIQALLVHIGERIFVVPLSNVMETLSADPEMIEMVEGVRVLRLREEAVLSIVRLSDILGYPPSHTREAPPLIILGHGTDRLALQVDALGGKQEVVVKSLGNLLKNVKNISGATILDQGKAALILDVPAVIESVRRMREVPQGDDPTLTVVVADDSLSTRRFHKLMLERARYSVFEASSGREALDIMLRNKVDVLITDMNMPVMDGLVLTKRVRQDPRLRHTRIMMITGLDDEESKRLAKEAGVDAFHRKPVPESEFLRFVGGEVMRPSGG